MDTFYNLLGKLQADPDLSSESDYEVFDPSEEAATWEEGGEVVNIKYSLDSYVQRRVYFLGRHPAWKDQAGINTGLFPITRRLAEKIFESGEEEISAQEVRSKEQLLDVLPLLPLPTTNNFDTIDDYGRLDSDIDASTDERETSPDTVTLPKQFSTNTTTRQPNSSKTLFRTKQTGGMDAPTGSKVSDKSNHPSSSPPTMPDRESGETRAPLPKARDSLNLAHLPVKNYSPEIMQSIGESLANLTGQTYPTVPGRGWSNTPGGVYYPPGVSALSNRPLDNPVKSQRKRAGDSDEAESVAAVGKAADSARSVLKKPKLSEGTAKSDEPESLEGIIDGTTLPETEAQAKAAAEIRHDRLLARHQITTKSTTDSTMTSTKSRPMRAAKSKKDPDLMPEFFNPKNFAKGEERDSVRCVCGAIRDDRKEMIACDGCNVWQHNACVGEAVPEEVESGEYLCHVCAPFVHRVVLARMRRDNPL